MPRLRLGFFYLETLGHAILITAFFPTTPERKNIGCGGSWTRVSELAPQADTLSPWSLGQLSSTCYFSSTWATQDPGQQVRPRQRHRHLGAQRRDLLPQLEHDPRDGHQRHGSRRKFFPSKCFIHFCVAFRLKLQSLRDIQLPPLGALLYDSFLTKSLSSISNPLEQAWLEWRFLDTANLKDASYKTQLKEQLVVILQ